MEKRLQNILAHAGVASRRHAAELIEAGKVKVDGKIVRERGLRFDPDLHDISVSGKAIPKEETKYYFLFNKPAGIISTVKDTHDRRKVTDFFSDIDARLYPVGRLDKDTTGVLIVTNDGKITHGLTHPSFEVDKEYIVDVDESIKALDIRKLEKGIYLEDKMTSPCSIQRERTGGKASYIVRLHEGRKRQIRRMFEVIGRKVVSLKRVKYAGLTLKGLKEGEFRPLTEEEIKRLKKLAENKKTVKKFKRF